MARDVQVVLKVAERCNINCSYCYYFNGGNDEPYHRPPYVSDTVVDGIVRFVRESASQLQLGRLRVVLHGGEPLMLKKSRFRSVCNTLSQLKELRPEAGIVMTTNGMLIDEEWIDIFEEFGIGVCVSLDGPREYHDLERVDFRGRGTYDRVIHGVELLKAAAAEDRIVEPSVLAVINPRFKGAVVYDHLIRRLGFNVADFRVPMTIHDSNPAPEDIVAVGRFLVDAFAEWTKDDNPRIKIRVFNTYLNRLLGRSGAYTSDDVSDDNSHIIVGVGSDGTMLNDDLMQVLGKEIFDRDLNICRNGITEYLSEVRKGVLAGVYHDYSGCVNCAWFNACRPGRLPWDGAEMRYSRGNGFQNKLVHCDAFQMLFESMASYIEMSRLPAGDAGVSSESRKDMSAAVSRVS